MNKFFRLCLCLIQLKVYFIFQSWNLIDKFLWIFDARPWKNATANKLKGKGFENIEYYPTCKLKFLDIPNISKIRDSYKKMMELCLKYYLY